MKSTSREEIADFLTNEGYRVLEAGSIAEFTPLIRQADIALLDVGLPVMASWRRKCCGRPGPAPASSC